MNSEELHKTHQEYDKWVGEWMFYMHSYLGGKAYKDGNYLLQHPFESSANYARRKETSYFYNYCGPIVDIFVSHLFRKPAKRDFGTLTDDMLFGSFYWDADLEGSSLVQFMRDAQRFASIYGRVSIIVDKPGIAVLTRAEAIEQDIRPYITLVTPENLLDWSYVRVDTGRPVLDMVKIREGDGLYRVWTRYDWKLYRCETDSSDVLLVDSGEHALGTVPMVNLFNKRSISKMVGISDLQDLADINKNIYYLCSDAKEIIENTAFPMLAVPYARPSSEEMEIGPRNILQFDPTEAGGKPYWLEPPHSSLGEIREWVKQDITEIHRIAKMGGVRSVEDFRAASSGVALDLEYQQLYAALSEKADNLEQAEMQILDLWARWEEMSFDGIIDYPDDFSMRDIERDLANVLKAQSANVNSAIFNRELEKRVVTAVLPKLNEKIKTEIFEEIGAGQN